MTPPTAEHVQGMLNGEAENPEPFTTPIARVIARLWAEMAERIEERATDGRGDSTGVPCGDCGSVDMPLDTTLTGKQWEMICPEKAGMLCAACIVRRASKLPHVINVCARIIFADDYVDGDPSPGGKFWQTMNNLDAPPPPVQAVAAPAKDRAEEMAEKIVFQHGVASGSDMIIGEWGRGSVWVKGYSSSVESVRLIFAMALRAYADEMIENASLILESEPVSGMQDEENKCKRVKRIRAMKSSAPKP